jgi:fumarate reductase flavoprotein subunit
VHYRSDFPQPGDLATSRFTVARLMTGALDISGQPVEFTRVKPGEDLLESKAAAE